MLPASAQAAATAALVQKPAEHDSPPDADVGLLPARQTSQDGWLLDVVNALR